MKKILLFLLPMVVFLIPDRAVAQNADVTVAVTRGSYLVPASVNGSSVTGTAFIAANAKRMDGTLFNNATTTIWIGTVAATQNGFLHDNIRVGYPILSSGTLRLDGIMSDAAYFTCDAGIASCNVRVLEGRQQ